MKGQGENKAREPSTATWKLPRVILTASPNTNNQDTVSESIHCNDRHHRGSLNKRVRAAVCVFVPIAFVLILDVGLSVVDAKIITDSEANLHTNEHRPIKEPFADESPYFEVAQFQLPKHKEQMYRLRGSDPPSPVTQRLKYEYSYGSESEIAYRRNPNLNSSVRDDLLLIVPELNGFITYRPNDWLETTLEVIAERDFAVQEEQQLILPNGETQFAQERGLSLFVDQAFARIKGVTDPFQITLGRRNFEDYRHWLYDTSMDGVIVSRKIGKFRTEAYVGREGYVPRSLFRNFFDAAKEKPDRINTYILYTDYRGIEDIRLAGYAIYRDDRAGEEGKPLHLGLRSQGTPTERFSYWAELGYIAGKDASFRSFSAYGFDVGSTYRFLGLPYNPNVTLGFAFGSGDDPNNSRNNEFRQTGLESNETKFGGVSEFNVYGEKLAMELSNIMIVTAGFGFRPAYNISVDLVYHYYRLDQIAEELRNSEITALMNQDETRLSKDVGNGLDIVLGFRSVFGIKRLGFDIRTGVFFPGKAFNSGAPDNGYSVITKFWW